MNENLKDIKEEEEDGLENEIDEKQYIRINNEQELN
jgi:hypothetical protein